MSTQCSLSDPVSGELTVEASAIPIYSIDLHLLRVESILLGEKIVTEKSVVQTTQVYALSHLVNIYNSTYLSLTNPWGYCSKKKNKSLGIAVHISDSRWRRVS